MGAMGVMGAMGIGAIGAIGGITQGCMEGTKASAVADIWGTCW